MLAGDDDADGIAVVANSLTLNGCTIVATDDATAATLDHAALTTTAVPERFVDVGIVEESIQGSGHIHFEHSAYIPRGPYSGAHFYEDDTEFALIVYISALGEFDGVSDRVSVGSPATATIEPVRTRYDLRRGQSRQMEEGKTMTFKETDDND